jgi:hypothetical protein
MTDSLFWVGTIEIKLKPSSLLSDTIVTEKILVMGVADVLHLVLGTVLRSVLQAVGRAGELAVDGVSRPPEC